MVHAPTMRCSAWLHQGPDFSALLLGQGKCDENSRIYPDCKGKLLRRYMAPLVGSTSLLISRAQHDYGSQGAIEVQLSGAVPFREIKALCVRLVGWRVTLPAMYRG